MKPLTLLLLVGAALMVSLSGLSSSAQVLFFDDFESGLGQWIGQPGIPHSGVTVADPLASGHANVLTFTALTIGGDAFSSSLISSSGSILLSFDYLGLQQPGSVAGNLGGFLGYSEGLPANHYWLFGTDPLPYPGAVELVDDGLWHSHSVVLNGATTGPFHIIIEDWALAGGVAGDAYFDNIQVQVAAVPELSTSVLTAVALGAMALGRKWYNRPAIA